VRCSVCSHELCERDTLYAPCEVYEQAKRVRCAACCECVEIARLEGQFESDGFASL
jgi:hypothetical protein